MSKKIFKNTYITGSGRRNYLKLYDLEDPIFTSFTFDIDFVNSPLFYTINKYSSDNANSLASSIENALRTVYNTMDSSSYDILPVYSAERIGNDKLGFGIQQNVYMDKPLYGATEYIYMVDKRNGSSSQNDVRYNSSDFANNGGVSSKDDSFRLGNGVKDIVNKSDKQWAEEQKKQADAQVKNCNNIMNDNEAEHNETVKKTKNAKEAYDNTKVTVKDENGKSKEMSEDEIKQKIDEYKKKLSDFDDFKSKIVRWVNDELNKYQNMAKDLYENNKCVQKIAKYEGLSSSDDAKKQTYYDELKKEYGKDFVDKYILGGKDSYMVKFRDKFNELVTYSGDGKNSYKSGVEDNKKSFLLETKPGDGKVSVRTENVLKKFKSELTTYGMIENGTLKCSIYAVQTQQLPDWLTKLLPSFVDFTKKCMAIAKDKDKYSEPKDANNICDDWATMSKDLMSFKCDSDASFTDFDSEATKKNNEILAKYEAALDEIKTKKYGCENGIICDKENATPDSQYGQYLSLKEESENDAYSQAESVLESIKPGADELGVMLNNYNSETEGNTPPVTNVSENNEQSEMSNVSTKTYDAPQTVLDMVGFISGMKKMINNYPYIIQGITGLDTAYNKNYGVKDAYLGSGDDKITLTCMESLDLRVSSMFNRYFNAVYDRQYRRERVPINLRRFNCSVYVHDVRNFVSKRSDNPKNRIIELTNMYYSVIEFRFYDCEIVPDETGNIFDNISNESPNEMKKTNFTFTYGNCVVNFVPYSEIAGHR